MAKPTSTPSSSLRPKMQRIYLDFPSMYPHTDFIEGLIEVIGILSGGKLPLCDSLRETYHISHEKGLIFIDRFS